MLGSSEAQTAGTDRWCHSPPNWPLLIWPEAGFFVMREGPMQLAMTSPVRTSSPLRSKFLALPLLAALVLPGCGMFAPKSPGDPVKISKSETDIAADLWARQHQPRKALEHALKAIDVHPENADAQHLTALIYLDFCRASKIGECRLSEAEKHARIAIAQRDDFLEAQNTLAVILIHQKKFKAARKVLRPITENMLYATPEIAWGNLGWAYLLEGKHEKAISALRRAVAAQPLFCVGNFRLGVAYRKTGARESAIEALTRAVETEAPGCSSLQDAYLERAELYLESGDAELSRSDLDRCVRLSKTTESGRRCRRLQNQEE